MRRTPCPEGFDPSRLGPPPLPQDGFTIQSIALDVAGRCNLACRYCAEAATQPPRPAMSAAVLRGAWEWFARQRPRASCTVHIGSGEPLLALPRLRQVESLIARERQTAEHRLAVSMTSNGTLVDDAVADWLAASGWELKISFDGPRAVHDRWRVDHDGAGSFERVAAALTSLVPRLGDRLCAAAVLCRGADPFAVFDAVSELGVQRLEIIPMVHEDLGVVPSQSDLARYEEFVFAYARRWRDGEQEPRLFLDRFGLFVTRVMGYKNQWVSCGAGRSYVAVGPDGGVYPCMRFVGLDSYRIGRLPAGVSPSLARAFQRGPGRRSDERDGCRSCWAAPLCCGPCFAAAEMFAIDHHCAMFTADAAAAVWLVHQLRQRNPQRLLAFLRF